MIGEGGGGNALGKAEFRMPGQRIFPAGARVAIVLLRFRGGASRVRSQAELVELGNQRIGG